MHFFLKTNSFQEVSCFEPKTKKASKNFAKENFNNDQENEKKNKSQFLLQIASSLKLSIMTFKANFSQLYST